MMVSSTLISSPIMAETVDKMVSDMGKARSLGADLVEIRLDYLKVFNHNEDLKTLIRESPLPTLFTYRPKWEGGQYDGDEKTATGCASISNGAWRLISIDIEFQVAHEFKSTPYVERSLTSSKLLFLLTTIKILHQSRDLGNLVLEMQATGADIVRIATTTLDITDVARIFQITVHSQVPQIPSLYNEGFKSVGFDGVYLHFLVDDIANFLQTYSSTDFAGFSVGIPHKEAALKCCDEVDPVAKSIGAINCM
ncbi:hypothetical protein M0R45_005401 [Rubus argutus]|uniref:Shikimate dehydrogenase substrate binding N-terminal domain-containing protein n=1 Tax=Rubus argutus TaxID=59490 RepID=A0AAW1YMQ7_RUBAR